MSGREVQRRAATLMLGAVGGDGFVLAGASAIREHGLTDRPTEDVDLFGSQATTVEQFAEAVTRAEAALEADGWQVERLRVHPLFARLRVSSPEGEGLDVDFAVTGAPIPRSRWRWGRCCPNATRWPGSFRRCTRAVRSVTSSTSTRSAPPGVTATPT